MSHASPASPGRLIVFEGLDGVGKSTQMQPLAQWLSARGKSVILTAEPGGTALGKQLEQLLKHGSGEAYAGRAEALLFLAARAEHVEQVLRPAIDAGQWVLCDRFTLSTLAYQGYGHGLDPVALADAEAYARHGLAPDRVYYFEASDATLAARREGRQADRIEARPSAYQARVRAGFEALAAAQPTLVRTIPAEDPPEVIQQALRQDLEPWL